MNTATSLPTSTNSAKVSHQFTTTNGITLGPTVSKLEAAYPTMTPPEALPDSSVSLCRGLDSDWYEPE